MLYECMYIKSPSIFTTYLYPLFFLLLLYGCSLLDLVVDCEQILRHAHTVDAHKKKIVALELAPIKKVSGDSFYILVSQHPSISANKEIKMYILFLEGRRIIANWVCTILQEFDARQNEKNKIPNTGGQNPLHTGNNLCKGHYNEEEHKGICI